MNYLAMEKMQQYPVAGHDAEVIGDQAINAMPFVDMIERMETVLFAALDQVIDDQRVQDDLIETLYNLAEIADLEAGR